MSEQVVLQMSEIRKGFYGAQVLHGINLDLRKGEILGLVGENGAGKSTMMNILGGVIPFDSGEMRLNGTAYIPGTPKDAQKSGIAFIHQELNLFSNLTVAENMFIDGLPRGRMFNVKYKEMREKAQEFIDKFELQATPNTKVESLPMGTRQMLEIAKALLLDAKIMIFDEPTTSLSHREKDKLFSIIQQLKENGVSIIYISHILEDIFHLCDRVSVLRDGHIIGTDDKCNLDKNRIIKMMVGRELSQVYPYIEKNTGEIVYTAKGIKRGDILKNVSLSLRSGEIVGLFGLMGAGRTELVRVLFGVDKMDEGEIIFNNKVIKNINPETCIKHEIAFVTEDRRQEGLLMPKSVQVNLVLAKLNKMVRHFGVVNRKAENSEAVDAITDLKIKVQNKDTQLVKNLSGGNQQKVVIGKWLMRAPKLFMMDEPTRGVDVGAKYEIYSLINDMAKKGSTILFISSEMEELMGICDRILVMNNGCITADIPRAEYSPEAIISPAIQGGKN